MGSETRRSGGFLWATLLPWCHPDYAEPDDGTRWLKLFEDYAKPHSREREAQLQWLPAFRHHTWQKHFERVAAFLEAEIGCGESGDTPSGPPG